jgi:hypothetical protein
MQIGSLPTLEESSFDYMMYAVIVVTASSYPLQPRFGLEVASSLLDQMLWQSRRLSQLNLLVPSHSLPYSDSEGSMPW